MKLRIRKIILFFLILGMLNIMGRAVGNEYMHVVFNEVMNKVDVHPELVSSGGGYTDVIEMYGTDVDGRGHIRWVLARLDHNGKFMRSDTLDRLGMNDICGFENMHTTAGGDLYIVVENSNHTYSVVFLKEGKGKAVRCYTTSTNSVDRITDISEQNQVCTFLVSGATDTKAYRIDPKEHNTTLIAEFDKKEEEPGDRVFFVLNDGSVIRRLKGKLYYNDRIFADLGTDTNITKLWEIDKGVYYLDALNGDIWTRYFGSTDGYKVRFEDIFAGSNGITYIDADINGGIWVIDNCERLIHYFSNTYVDLTENITRPRYVSVLILLTIELIMIFVSLVLWYLIAVRRRMYYSLVVRWGAYLFVLFCVIRILSKPYVYSAIFNELVKDEYTYLNTLNQGEPRLDLLRKTRSDFNLVEFELEDDKEIYYQNTEGKSNIEMLFFGADYISLIEEAMKSENGCFNAYYYRNDRLYFISATKIGYNRVRAVSVRDYVYLTDMYRLYTYIVNSITAFMTFIWLVVIGILVSYSVRVIIISRRSRNLLTEEESVVDFYGDEISELNYALNAAGLELREYVLELKEHKKVYEKFMPKNIVELLGVRDAHEINRETSSTNELIMMTVSFSLDADVYDDDSEGIFKKMNSLVGRSSEILDHEGGTVLDFRYDGFVAYFKERNPSSVVAAVKIVQEFRNDDKAKAHVVIDSNTVKSGIVGNDEKMQAVAISESYSTIGKLLNFVERAETSILCTENVISLVGQYPTRYVGKIKEKKSDLRVYELYGGDMPELISRKMSTEKIFLDALYSFYSGDYKTARGELLQVVRKNPYDGIAKYYLYLADTNENRDEGKIFYLE